MPPPTTHPWLLYGATGYTGELVAREAARRGHAPVLAGRNAAAVGALAAALGAKHRAFALDDVETIRRGLDGVAAVLNCAGPFVRTSAPMVEACLASGVHYLDITGEIPVFEAVLARGEAARRAGVALLPGVGFDVVPSDCLAARLAEALPDAVDLALAFHGEGTSMSRGTLKTMIESLPHLGAVRRDGRIVPVPPAWDVRKVPFSCGERWAMTIPWGDVSTAYHSTGIPDVRVYSGTPPRMIRRFKRLAPLLPLLGAAPVKRFLQRRVERRVTGPSEAARAAGRMYLWGEVRNAAGAAVSGTLDTPEGYALTVLSSLASLERLLAGGVSPGAWTPSRAFGWRFVTELPGVVLGEPRPSAAL
jgi:short subunit dehydrogenase-like uncharacterized protein